MSDTHSHSTGSPSGEAGSDTRTEGPSSGWLSRILGAIGLKSNAATLREDLKEALEEVHDGETSAFSQEERELIRNILRLKETRAEDVMVPRGDIDAVAQTITLTDLMLLFKESGHSRMPVYRDSLDDAYGMVHIRDLMGHIAEAAAVFSSRVETRERETAGLSLTKVDLSRTLAETPDLVREILTIPQWIPVTDLLAQMQQKRIQIALVIDEYGGVDGLVSLEDIVEVVVGDIEDEHDVTEAPGVVAAGVDAWIVDGQTELDELAEAISPLFGAASLTDEVDTLAGLVVMLAGRVPAVGERITAPDEVPGFAFEVLEADDLRVIKAKVVRISTPTEDVGAVGAAK